MTLTHSTHAGYIYQPDVFTDENGTEFIVTQDNNSDDPRNWLTRKEAALVVVDGDRNTRLNDLRDYEDNPAIKCFQEMLDDLDSDNWQDISVHAWRERLQALQLNYDVDIITENGYSQSDWFTAIIAVKEGYGTARSYAENFRMWVYGDVYMVSTDGDNLGGIYADSPQEAAEYYIANYYNPQTTTTQPNQK